MPVAKEGGTEQRVDLPSPADGFGNFFIIIIAYNIINHAMHELK